MLNLTGLGRSPHAKFITSSQVVYREVTYLRLVHEGWQVHCALLMAKSRLASLKSISIPRLELSAATVAVRLDKIIRRELELSVEELVFWTDSTSVSQILDGSSVVQWRLVPADFAWDLRLRPF